MNRRAAIFAVVGGLAFILLLISARRNLQVTSVPGTNVAKHLEDSEPVAIEKHPTLSEIQSGKFPFFDQKGVPLVGYSETTNGITLYNWPARNSAVGAAILPITRAKVDAYVRMLEAQAKLDKANKEAEMARVHQDKLIEEIRNEKATEERKKKEEADAAIRAAEKKERERVAESNATVRAAVELATYRERYITANSSFDRAVLIVDEKGNQNLPLSSLIADALRQKGAKTTVSFFKPAFVKDGLFAKAFIGQGDALDRLPLTNTIHNFVLGRQNVTYKPNPELSGVITATMKLDLNAGVMDGLRSSASQSLQSIGAGFTEDEARTLAEERIISQLTNGVLGKIEQSLSSQ
jgi:hypothetical protein